MRWARASAAIGLLLLSSCSVRIAPDYDPVLDQSASEVATTIDAFLSRMETLSGAVEGTYSYNREFYAETAAVIRILRLRAEAAPRTSRIVSSLSLILENVEELRALHEDQGERGLRQPEVESTRDLFASQFRQLFAYQAALRRGE